MCCPFKLPSGLRSLKIEERILQKHCQLTCRNNVCGRTLTLILKTASFEVRTRAMSLHKYVHSKEDILGYASKLLKAELPLSLRLIGLRMSQFRDDKYGPRDPMQKTLTSFIGSGTATSHMFNVSESTGLEISDNHLIHDGEINLSVGDECSFSNNDGNISLPNELEELLESNQLASIHKDSSRNDSEGICNLDGVSTSKAVNEVTAFEDEKVVGLSNHKTEPLWVDDCICSVCGIELPPSFIEERQEHLDYHLAQMLQAEESMHTKKERLMWKPLQGSNGARKKYKPSSKEDKKHIPIDAFFTKSKKNL